VAVRIRLKRLGRTNRAFWRICATDKHSARDGRVLEELGHYDPLLGDLDKVKINRERVVDWLKHGAAASDTVAQLLAHLGIGERGDEIPPKPWPKKKKAPPPPAAARVEAAKAQAAEAQASAAPDAPPQGNPASS